MSVTPFNHNRDTLDSCTCLLERKLPCVHWDLWSSFNAFSKTVNQTFILFLTSRKGESQGQRLDGKRFSCCLLSEVGREKQHKSLSLTLKAQYKDGMRCSFSIPKESQTGLNLLRGVRNVVGGTWQLPDPCERWSSCLPTLLLWRAMPGKEAVMGQSPKYRASRISAMDQHLCPHSASPTTWSCLDIPNRHLDAADAAAATVTATTTLCREAAQGCVSLCCQWTVSFGRFSNWF